MKVIFVCTGNTCRSPMAQAYLESKHLCGVEVQSRGLFASGEKASENAVTVMKELGHNISEHISRSLSTDDLDADIFIALSESHRDQLYSCGIPDEKIILLGNGIPDPYGSNTAVYRLCRDAIINAVDELVFSGIFTGFQVKSAERRHLSDIARLEKCCFSEPWSENALAESFAAGTRFFVAECESGLMGYVGISSVIDEGYITNVAVFPQYRRKGVARLLLDRVFCFARQKALSFVSLEVRASNIPAIVLYEQTGFVKEGRRRNFYRDPTEDALIMTRRFNKFYENSEY